MAAPNGAAGQDDSGRFLPAHGDRWMLQRNPLEWRFAFQQMQEWNRIVRRGRGARVRGQPEDHRCASAHGTDPPGPRPA